MSKPTDEELRDLVQLASAPFKKLCSPVHRCFPPQPTVCLICGATDASACPMRRDDDVSSNGNYHNLRGDEVHDGDVFT